MHRLLAVMAACAAVAGALVTAQTRRIPTFEFKADQSRASRARWRQLLKPTGAERWIEHDIATHEKLPTAPAFVA